MAEAAKKHGIRSAPALRSWLRTATLLSLTPLLVSTPGTMSAAQATSSTPARTASPQGSAPDASTPAAHAARSTVPAAVRAAQQSATQTATQTATQRPYSGTGSRTAEVSLNTVTPVAPDEDDTLTVSGTVTNRGKTEISAAEIVLYSGQRLPTRSAIEQATKRAGFAPGQEGTKVTGKNTTEAVDNLAPGQTRSFSLRVPVDRLNLGDDGVYQLGVTLTGQSRGEPYEHVLGVERTFMPRQGDSAESSTDLTFVWPLLSTTHLTARTESDRRQTPVFRDDTLAKEIAPGGRLQQLVALGKDLPVSWLVDPDLLASVDAMTKPYKVETPEGNVPGQGQQNARRWLNELQSATEDKEIVALPFGDPDLAALAHSGKAVSGTLSHLRPATDVARKTVETVLHTTPNTDFAWPVEGAVDPSIISVATSAGARKVLTRSDSLRETGGLPYTPTAARPIGGGVTAVSADARLSKLFEGDMTRAENATKAVQQFVAQSLALTEQRASGTRSIVVAPHRMPTTSQARTMATAVQALEDSGSWTDFVELGEAAKAKPDPKATKRVPGTGAYPAKLRERELGTDAFKQLQRTQGTLDDFTVILSQGDRVVTPFGNALRRELSTSWRGRNDEAGAYRESVQAYLTELTRQVGLVQKSRMTLSGRSATIPVTVQNNLIQPVDGLELRLTSGRRIGLEIKEERKQVVVDGGHSQSLKFETTAKANGRTSIEARLFTKDNKPYGPPMRFQVDVTEITSTVLLVIAGGVLLVVLAGVRMYTQRRRQGPMPDPDAPLVPEPKPEPEPEPDEKPEPEPEKERTEPEEDERSGADEGPEPDQTPDPDADQTSDQTSDQGAGPAGEAPAEVTDSSDTGPENPDTPDTGEKVDR